VCSSDLCDGGLWLLFLPGLMLLLAGAAADLGAGARNVALGMVGVSGLGLVLTQGRNEESFLAKAVTGVVSLYGILGSYGTTQFLSDTLSYSRLLALGLATVVIGMAFNYIAALLSAIPLAGVVLFVVALVFGHTFNFGVSFLSGFVHSVRLIFVEMFSRFYEGGARPFAPLGVPRAVRIIDE
jgi:V/A-type H+-transporting ATPase subunit I